MTVRPRTDGDLPALVGALRGVHERDGYPVRWHADMAAWLTPDGLRAAWVVEHDGRLVGHAALTAVQPDDAASTAWSTAAHQPPARLSCLTRLFVAVGCRGTGAGAALLTAAVEHARDEGRTAVLEVSPSDLHAVALYRRHGWRHAADGPARWWVPGGGPSLLLLAPSPASDATPARRAAPAPRAAPAGPTPPER